MTASVEALPGSRIRHYVYLSVAQPAPVMRAYVAVRAEGEARLRVCVEAGTLESAVFLRPWYVLGPGHRWAYALLPLYKLLEAIPATREGARRNGMVTLDRMLAALMRSVAASRPGSQILEVPAIRSGN